MVAYGPWQQDPDYEQSATYTESATFDNRYLGDDGGGGYTDNGYSGTPRQVLTADLESALFVAKDSHGDVDRPIDHGVEFGYDQDYTIVPEQYISNWGAIYMRVKWRVAPSPDGYSYWPPNYGHFDPAAIALQYEGSEPGPISLSGTAAIEGVSLDALSQICTRVGDSTATDSLVDENLSGIWETDVVVQPDGSPGHNVVHTIPGFIETTTPNALQTQLATDVDLTALLAGAGWSGSVWTETAAFVPPNHMPPSGDSVDSGDLRYGWVLLEPRITYLVRPPRYRWVYATAPYRRTFPSDATVEGARRTFPPSKALQSGRRTSGGYL